MTLTATPRTTPTSPPVVGRVAILGLSPIGGEIADQLQSRGFLTHSVGDLSGPGTRDCDAVILLVAAGQEAAAAALCASLAAKPAFSVIAVYAGPGPGFAIDALDAGADDCLCAPVNPREVVARVRSALRRRALRDRRGRLERVDQFVIDHVRMRVQVGGDTALSLTPAQFRLLSALARRRGAVVERETLVAEVLGEHSESYDRAIDVQICRLRKRLARAGLDNLIAAIPGVGYRLATGPADLCVERMGGAVQ